MKTNWDSGKENRYKSYLKKVDKWRKKHKISRKQFASIFLENSSGDWRSLFWSESVDFKYQMLNE